MNHLPDEILGSIFKYTIKRQVNQLFILQIVCKRFYRLSNNAYLWYYAFKEMYPKWSFHINYAYDKQPLINWKQCIVKLHKEKKCISSQNELETILSKSRHNKHLKPSFHINGFISHTIDKEKNTGIIGISKQQNECSKHKILFYTFPDYKLIRKLKFQFMINDESEWKCQIIGIQTVELNNEKLTLFAVALTQPHHSEEDEENEDRTCDWKSIIIYKLDLKDGSTTCLANIELGNVLFGRGTWFFKHIKDMNSWLEFITTPDNIIQYDSNHSLFLLLYGVNPHDGFGGSCQVIHFDTRENHTLSDPSQTLYEWDEENHRYAISSLLPRVIPTHAKIISAFNLEARVSCMEHFHFSNELNHLICTGNFHGEELSIYDWRFGIKVGILLPKESPNNRVQPWGLEFSFAIPPPTSSSDTLVNYGPRLIVVGDSEDKFQVKVWDISHLFKVEWHPFEENNERIMNEDIPMMSRKYPWWNKRTSALEKLVLKLYDGELNDLPYTIDSNSIQLVHVLNTNEFKKYTAYINLHTWLYLIYNNSILTVLDIETGEFLSSLSLIEQGEEGADDVIVVGNKEIIVTGKYHLLKSTVLP